MSDPMTNMEIQDVLSSIRRLVSEDNRRKPAEEARAPAQDESGAGEAVEKPESVADDEGGKLVLTEALRVGDARGGAATGDADHGDLLPGDDADIGRVPDASSLEETIAELEAAVAGIGGEFEPDGSEVLDEGAADASLDEAFEDGFAVDLAAEEEEAEGLARPVTSGAVDAEAPVAESAAVDSDRPGDDAGPVTEMAAEAEETSAPGQDDSVQDVADGDDVPADAAGIEALPAAEDVADAPSGADMPKFVSSSASTSLASTSSGGVTELVGTNRIRRLNLTGSDMAAEEQEAGTAERQEAAETDLTSADAQATNDTADGPGLFDAGTDEAVLDMDMLRDLVAEIIRDELQGPLGERITRNVRMLVRREINRALESRDLE